MCLQKKNVILKELSENKEFSEEFSKSEIESTGRPVLNSLTRKELIDI